MIFYFTGTGNSYDAAMRVAGENALISITECVRSRQFAFTLEEGEQLGFVLPVYFAGIPSIVAYFIHHLEITGRPSYCFGLLTCGGEAFAADHMLDRELYQKGLTADAIFTLTMPDNYILLYEPQDDVSRQRALKEARKELETICDQIKGGIHKELQTDTKGRLMTSVMYPLYVRGRKTEKFWVDEKCVGCGTCAGRCPANAIEMQSGKPVWVKERCVQCLSCLRCNAVQYGTKTKDRSRYTNPALKKK